MRCGKMCGETKETSLRINALKLVSLVRMKGFEPMPRGRLQKISVQKAA